MLIINKNHTKVKWGKGYGQAFILKKRDNNNQEMFLIFVDGVYLFFPKKFIVSKNEYKEIPRKGTWLIESEDIIIPVEIVHKSKSGSEGTLFLYIPESIIIEPIHLLFGKSITTNKPLENRFIRTVPTSPYVVHYSYNEKEVQIFSFSRVKDYTFINHLGEKKQNPMYAVTNAADIHLAYYRWADRFERIYGIKLIEKPFGDRYLWRVRLNTLRRVNIFVTDEEVISLLQEGKLLALDISFID